MSGLESAPMARVNSLPDPAFQQLRPVLAERLERLASSLRPEQFGSVLSPLMREVLERGFAQARADEGTVWLLDEAGENLMPAYNTGPQAAQLVGRFKQPLNSGLICMVFASEQPFIENEVWKNARQSKLLDIHLQVQTWAMIAVPFYFLGSCRGVISCVQLKRATASEPQPPGFGPEHFASVQLTAALLSRLTEFELLSRAVGWTSE
jgi:hypothetical protein